MDQTIRRQLIAERRFDELLPMQVAEVQAAADDPDLRRQLAWLLAALGRMEEASAEQREACRLRPDDARYADELARYEARLRPSATAAQPPPTAAAPGNGAAASPAGPAPSSAVVAHTPGTVQTSSEVAETFRRIYERNESLGAESVSGPGSSLTATAPLRAALPILLRGLQAETMLHAPCGDFGWMSSVELGAASYIGVDVVPEIVDAARERADDRHDFIVADITTDSLPQADLVLCRDCLVHLSEQNVFAAIANFKQSGSRFVLTTTFYALAENPGGDAGGWRPINLQRPPFSFPQPMVLIPERSFDPAGSHTDKSLGLWELSSLPDVRV